MDNIYIFSGLLQNIATQEGDLTGIPPGASLYAPDVWAIMVAEYGDEAGLIADIGVEDVRDD
ncbi:MAG: hypothetical protein WC343_14205 [Bacilli bacterium]|jgi:hypothetical protein